MIRGFYDLEDINGYRKFIRFALRYADNAGVSYTSDFSAFKESKWWGNLGESIIGHEYDESGTLMLLLKKDHSVYEWLKGKRSIFDFFEEDDGNFLWDICLYKEDREIFSSVTHEREVYISDELYEEYAKENQ